MVSALVSSGPGLSPGRTIIIQSIANFSYNIARNHGHFAPVINCQRNLIFKMADKDYRSQGKRIPYDILNNLSSVDLFYEEKGKKKTSSKKILGVYQAERLIARIHTADQKPAA